MQVYLASDGDAWGKMKFTRPSATADKFEVELTDISLGFKLVGGGEPYLVLRPPDVTECRLPVSHATLRRTSPTKWGGALWGEHLPHEMISLALPGPAGDLDAALDAAMKDLANQLTGTHARTIKLRDARDYAYTSAVVALILLGWEQYLLHHHPGRWSLQRHSPTELLHQGPLYTPPLPERFTLDLAPELEEAEAPEPEPEPLLTV